MKTLLSVALSLIFSFAAFGQENKQIGDKAIVYVYSIKAAKTLGQVRKSVLLDDKEIAEMRPARYFIAVIPSGKHAFHLKSKKHGGIEMDFEAGKTYYLQFLWNSGATVTPAGIVLAQPENGTFTVKQLTPVDDGNIKDKARAFTKLPE